MSVDKSSIVSNMDDMATRETMDESQNHQIVNQTPKTHHQIGTARLLIERVLCIVHCHCTCNLSAFGNLKEKGQAHD